VSSLIRSPHKWLLSFLWYVIDFDSANSHWHCRPISKCESTGLAHTHDNKHNALQTGQKVIDFADFFRMASSAVQVPYKCPRTNFSMTSFSDGLQFGLPGNEHSVSLDAYVEYETGCIPLTISNNWQWQLLWQAQRHRSTEEKQEEQRTKPQLRFNLECSQATALRSHWLQCSVWHEYTFGILISLTHFAPAWLIGAVRRGQHLVVNWCECICFHLLLSSVLTACPNLCYLIGLVWSELFNY